MWHAIVLVIIAWLAQYAQCTTIQPAAIQVSRLKHGFRIAQRANGTRPLLHSGCNARTMLAVAERIARAHEYSRWLRRHGRVRVFEYDASTSVRGCLNQPASSYCTAEDFACSKRQRLMGSLSARLNASSSALARTLDPAAADLLVIPCYALPQAHARRLPHLTAHSAHRHVLIFAQTIDAPPACDLRERWPVQLFNLQWPAHCGHAPGGFDPSSLPYPSERQAPRAEPAGRARARPVLASFIGHAHGTAAALRSNVMAACRAAPSAECSYAGPKEMGSRAELHALKRRSTFCLEVAGDTAYRQSLTDDLLAGCIPVLLSPEMASQHGLHWHAWRNATTVLATWVGGEAAPRAVRVVHARTPRARVPSAATVRRAAATESADDRPVDVPARAAASLGAGDAIRLRASSFAALLAQLMALRDGGGTSVARMRQTIDAHSASLRYRDDLDRAGQAGVRADLDALDTLFVAAAMIAEEMEGACSRAVRLGTMHASELARLAVPYG